MRSERFRSELNADGRLVREANRLGSSHHVWACPAFLVRSYAMPLTTNRRNPLETFRTRSDTNQLVEQFPNRSQYQDDDGNTGLNPGSIGEEDEVNTLFEPVSSMP